MSPVVAHRDPYWVLKHTMGGVYFVSEGGSVKRDGYRREARRFDTKAEAREVRSRISGGHLYKVVRVFQRNPWRDAEGRPWA